MNRIILLVFTCWSVVVCAQSSPEKKPIHQLRIYTIPTENKPVFHDRFRDHAQRIMKTYGFNIVAMWDTEFENTIEFVYLLQWPDEHTMKTAWQNFMNDQEWKDIKVETSKLHGTFVIKIEDRTLIPTDYGPTLDVTKSK